jgi:hypothetical protein
MTKEQKISALNTRIAILEARAGRENKNIVKKIKRKIRDLEKTN